MTVGITQLFLDPVLGFSGANSPQEIMGRQGLKRKQDLPQADQTGIFLGRERGFTAELLVEPMEYLFEGKIFGFFLQRLPSVAEPYGFFGVSHVQKMALDSVAMDLQSLGGADNVTVVDHEPMQEVVSPQVVRLEATFP